MMPEPCDHGFANRNNCQWCADKVEPVGWCTWILVIAIVVGVGLLWTYMVLRPLG